MTEHDTDEKEASPIVPALCWYLAKEVVFSFCLFDSLQESRITQKQLGRSPRYLVEESGLVQF